MYQKDNYFIKYIFSGTIVTSYSILALLIFNQKYFILGLIFVEISSHIIRWNLFKNYVYKNLNSKKILVSLSIYLKSIFLPFILNLIIYLLFPFNSKIMNILRVIFISGILGFLWSKHVYTKK